MAPLPSPKQPHFKLGLLFFSVLCVCELLAPWPSPSPSPSRQQQHGSSPNRELGFFRSPPGSSPCAGGREHAGFPDACSYARAQPECKSGGFIQYIQAFYCFTQSGGAARRWLAYGLFSVWLVALFYMLGNTAADYFCACLERLSALLRIPPTLAGVTLLPLGNGAPDVFASLVSFIGSGSSDVGRGGLGLSSVLGGALFVVTVVAGLVNAVVASNSFSSGEELVTLNRWCFLRDGAFFLASLFALAFILWQGSIGVWGAVGYLSIYVLYAITVAATELWFKVGEDPPEAHDVYASLLPKDEEAAGQRSLETVVTLPPWMWASQVAIYSRESSKERQEEEVPSPVAAGTTGGEHLRKMSLAKLGRKASEVLLDYPRQLTIPVVGDGSHTSRLRAVATAAFAPLLLAVLVGGGRTPVLAVGLAVGLALCLAAAAVLPRDRPPGGAVELVWLAGGFGMSIVWFYAIARELVAALLGLAAVMGVEQASLGATVLAWGNSTGDLVANMSMARGSAAGVQMAIAGCYAGPMFNTLFGLGVSLLAAVLKSGGAEFRIQDCEAGLVSVGFLVAGILAAMVAMPARGMKPSRALGLGLVVLYGGFLATRAWQSFFA